jgi:2-polyprenyl-3-methyl-5-hydroxy-6-metoxy-1,4-benzoquinol methylase
MKQIRMDEELKPPSYTLERIYPEHFSRDPAITGSSTLDLHLRRYAYAGENMAQGVIADVACGSGYGSNFLATGNFSPISRLLAIDNDTTAIHYANQHYVNPVIQFILADACLYRPDKLLNTVISLETIEHLQDPVSFVKHWASFLSSGGRFIASAPITPSMDANPFHLHDFTLSTFKKLFLDAGLTELTHFIQVQKYNPLNVILKRKIGRSKEIRKGIAFYYLKKPSKLILRIRSILQHGFRNKYVIMVFQKP